MLVQTLPRQGAVLQAWPKTGHKEECFHIYFGDFGSVSHPPASVHSCHSHTRVLCFMMSCAWCCLLTSKSCLGQILIHLAQLGALESDVVPEGTVGSVGWSCALGSAQRTDSG